MEQTSSKRVQISKQIREDWGTVKHFCKKNDINHNTFDVVMNGVYKSKPIAKILIAYGYIKHADELMKDKAVGA